MMNYEMYEEDRDDLDTMVDPAFYLDNDELSSFEEGFIRGFVAAAA